MDSTMSPRTLGALIVLLEHPSQSLESEPLEHLNHDEGTWRWSLCLTATRAKFSLLTAAARRSVRCPGGKSV
ncbi:hypothetical protein MA16_Dca008561 [Dendrobium catenatum]|uniref:Uncharacterized protein n=1 Tax=Dendrobium catenatum TaxID=906689 RepID=A0A2I0XHT0_9ASPA|nr:hypothetical protein MA16_Dca008561 [Dendrobium catenatum]